jgi:hypothetical protein
MTRYLGNYLADECGLTDHRGDPAYRNWDDLLPVYEQELKDMEGTSYPRIEKNLKKNKDGADMEPAGIEPAGAN